MEAYFPLKDGALDLIRRELPRDAFVIQACMTTLATGDAVRIEYTTFDQLGLDRPARASMLYTLGQIASLVDGFPKGGVVVGVFGDYAYPYKRINNVAFAHGHVERRSKRYETDALGETVRMPDEVAPLTAYPIPERVLQAIPHGARLWNAVRLDGASLELRFRTADGVDGIKTVGMAKLEDLPESVVDGWSAEQCAGYVAEYEFFKNAIARSRMWRQFMGFRVRVLLPEE